MSSRKKKPDNKTLPLPFGKYDHKNQLIGLLGDVVRKSGLSREQIAPEMSRLSGHPVTLNMLNNYLAGGKDKEPYNFPAHLLAAFCIVCNDFEPLFFMNRACGMEAVSEETLEFAQLGQLWLEKDDVEAKEQALKWSLKKKRR